MLFQLCWDIFKKYSMPSSLFLSPKTYPTDPHWEFSWSFIWHRYRWTHGLWPVFFLVITPILMGRAQVLLYYIFSLSLSYAFTLTTNYLKNKLSHKRNIYYIFKIVELTLEIHHEIIFLNSSALRNVFRKHELSVPSKECK